MFDVLPDARVQPFFVAGVGAPLSLSFDTDVLGHGVVGEGYVGGGVRFERARGWSARLDLRWEIVPGRGDPVVTHEGELLASLYRRFGATDRSRGRRRGSAGRPAVADADRDGIADDDDECPRRPEDRDNFEDGDGCPDIDNDLDGVLDIADKCPTEDETYNGFRDMDGCLDFVPDEITAFTGTAAAIELRRGKRLTRASRRALKAAAEALATYPSVRLDIVADTVAQAAVVRDYLLDRGVKATRLRVAARAEDAAGEGVVINVRVPKGHD